MTPMFAAEKTAAKLLDMKPKLFRELIAAGILPPPVNIGEHERWDVEGLQRAIRGGPDELRGMIW